MPRDHDSDPSAFPTNIEFGMTLRDYFAAHAMPTIHKGNDDYIARRAYELADAMMKERDL